ncbi:DUF4199 domain-containing protein [Pseudobacter ginsenosidimutans]|uniref:Uncharacterized protein DUF4199 n=1 Tax=Pseudobacter ginsenosidimutans TaxID=661488 RepID=A0A4Q7N4J2_9BACT|nr:DUF4199 domain-containing protein [Pseudobacter ginsenosidimutans]RZS75918.1 uncharacterized protein DUF4199 [Pseudobacter ginsenosidimutans]
MTSPTGTTAKSNVGLTYGLIGGIAMIVYTLCLYLVGIQAFMNFGLAFLVYGIIIFIAVLAGLKQKKLQGGYLSFAEALKTVFLTFVLAFLLSTIFNFVLLNYIDPGFRDQMAQATMEKLEGIMRRLGAPDSDIEKAMEGAASADNYTFAKMLLGYGTMCILFCLISLVIAAIIKKNRPPFDNAFKE